MAAGRDAILLILAIANNLQRSESFGVPAELLGFELSWKGGIISGYVPSALVSGCPVFLYLNGRYDAFGTEADDMFSRQMALRGYVAAAVKYNNWVDIPWGSFKTNFCELRETTEQIFSGNESALAKVCSISNTDCTKGIAVMGNGHGAMVAAFSPEFAPVTALLSFSSGTHNTFWLFGRSSEPLECLTDQAISKHLQRVKRRSIAGETDYLFGTNRAGVLLQQKSLSGYDCGSARDCIQSDGSGYYVVSEDELGVRAEHGLFADYEPVLRASALICPFLTSSAKWAMLDNLNWLAHAASLGARTADLKMASVFDARCINSRKFSYIPLDELVPQVVIYTLLGINVLLLCCGLCVFCFCCSKPEIWKPKSERSELGGLE